MEESGQFVSKLASLHFCSRPLDIFSYHLTLAQAIKHLCRIIHDSPFKVANHVVSLIGFTDFLNQSNHS